MPIQFLSCLPSPFPEANFLRTSPVSHPCWGLDYTCCIPTPAPSAEFLLLLLGTGDSLYQDFCLRSVLSHSSGSPICLSFLPWAAPRTFPKTLIQLLHLLSPSHFPKSGAMHTRPNSWHCRKGFTRPGKQTNISLRKEHSKQTDWLMTWENSISNMRMSSIRSVLPLWRPKKKFLGNRKSQASPVKPICFYLKPVTQVEADLYVPFCFRCYGTPESNVWPDSSSVKHCPVLTLRLHPLTLHTVL